MTAEASAKRHAWVRCPACSATIRSPGDAPHLPNRCPACGADLSAERNAAPRRYGATGIATLSDKWMPGTTGPVAVYLEPQDALKLLTDGKRLAIKATTQTPEGAGFEDGNDLGPDFFAVAAQDLSVLNRQRLAKMKGVNDELAQGFIARGDEHIAAMPRSRYRYRRFPPELLRKPNVEIFPQLDCPG